MKKTNAKNLFPLSVLILYFATAGVPVIYALVTAFGELGFSEALANVLSADLRKLLLQSCADASLTALFSTALGTVLGFVLFKTKTVFGNFFKIAAFVPVFFSPYVLAVAWSDLFFMAFGSSRALYSHAGVIWILTLVYTPLSTLIIGSALANIDFGLEESGLMFAKPSSVISKIVLPLIKPALTASFILVFIFSVSEFSVPAFLHVKVYSTEIFTRFSAFYNHSLATAQSGVLIVVSIALLFVERKYISQAPFFSIGGKGKKTKTYDGKKTKLFGTIAVAGWFSVSVVLPFIVLVSQTFFAGKSRFAEAVKLLSPAFVNSVLLAFAGAIAITVTGFAAAYYSENTTHKKLASFFTRIMLILFAVPSAVLGISFILFYNARIFTFIYTSSFLIILAYAGRFAFIATKIVENSLKQIPASFKEVAILSGASEKSFTLKILLPLVSPALFAAFVSGFVFGFGELGATVMLYPPGSEIMSIKVFTVAANAPQNLTSAMTLTVFTVTLFFVSVFFFAGKKITKKFSAQYD